MFGILSYSNVNLMLAKDYFYTKIAIHSYSHKLLSPIHWKQKFIQIQRSMTTSLPNNRKLGVEDMTHHLV